MGGQRPEIRRRLAESLNGPLKSPWKKLDLSALLFHLPILPLLTSMSRFTPHSSLCKEAACTAWQDEAPCET